jgi:nucleotide-binding universal stress UspA family protein
MKTIVVGYDETEPAKRALARAAELAKAFGSKVIVTSVAGVIHGRGIGPVDPIDPPELHEEELRHAQSFLAEHGIEGELDVALGDPADHILRLAEEREADLIVVGSRGAHAVERLLGLSVSGSVGRRAHCDVLIVH